MMRRYDIDPTRRRLLIAWGLSSAEQERLERAADAAIVAAGCTLNPDGAYKWAKKAARIALGAT